MRLTACLALLMFWLFGGACAHAVESKECPGLMGVYEVAGIKIERSMRRFRFSGTRSA